MHLIATLGLVFGRSRRQRLRKCCRTSLAHTPCDPAVNEGVCCEIGLYRSWKKVTWRPGGLPQQLRIRCNHRTFSVIPEYWGREGELLPATSPKVTRHAGNSPQLSAPFAQSQSCEAERVQPSSRERPWAGTQCQEKRCRASSWMTGSGIFGGILRDGRREVAAAGLTRAVKKKHW